MTLKKLFEYAYEYCVDRWYMEEADELSYLTATENYQDLKEESLENLTIQKRSDAIGAKTMKDDLISRQAAIDAIDVLCQEHRYRIPGKVETYSQYNEAWQDALDRAEGVICNLPSADAVKAVRCKDCKYRDHDRCEIWEYCKVPDMGYCYEGVKK